MFVYMLDFVPRLKPVSQITHMAPNVYSNNTLHMYVHMYMYAYAVPCVYVRTYPDQLCQVTYIIYYNIYVCTYVSTVRYVLTCLLTFAKES